MSHLHKKDFRRRLPSGTVLGLLCVSFLTGCGEAPGVQTFPGDVPVPAVRWEASLDLADQNENGDNLRDFEVDGDAGGQISFGRLGLNFPPKALLGNNIITIRQVQQNQATWELTVNRQHKANFSKPVTLSVDYSDLGEDDMFAVFWFDKEANAWVNMGGAMDSNTKTLSLTLDHFSYYAFVCIHSVDPDGSAGWN